MAEKSRFGERPLDRQPLYYAVIGIACLMAAGRSMTFTTLSGILPVEFDLVWRHLLSTAVAVIMFFVFRRNAWLAKNPILPSIVTGLLVACILCKYQAIFGLDIPVLLQAGRILEEALIAYLLIIWAKELIPCGFANVASTAAFGLILTGVLLIVFSLLQETPTVISFAILPVISLYCFLRFARSENKPEDMEDFFLELSSDEASAKVRLGGLVFILVIIGSLSMFAAFSSYLSLEIQQAMSSNPLMQVCIAAGLVAGGMLLTVVMKQRRSTLLIFVLQVSLAVIAMVLILQPYGGAIATALYLLLSYILVAALSFLVWCAGFQPSTSLPAYCLGYAAMSLGKLVPAIVAVTPAGTDADNLRLLGIISLALFAVSAIGLTHRVLETEARAMTNAKEGKVRPFRQALERISTRSGLTAQETKIFEMLAYGRNAKSISETLVLSPNTVKAHMRNLYQKLDVHSQQELMDLVNSEVVK